MVETWYVKAKGMKFSCDNCSAQYMIADEKLGKRGVKVRCKKCSYIIILRPEGYAGPVKAKGPAEAPQASAAESPETSHDFGLSQEFAAMGFESEAQGSPESRGVSLSVGLDLGNAPPTDDLNSPFSTERTGGSLDYVPEDPSPQAFESPGPTQVGPAPGMVAPPPGAPMEQDSDATEILAGAPSESAPNGVPLVEDSNGASKPLGAAPIAPHSETESMTEATRVDALEPFSAGPLDSVSVAEPKPLSIAEENEPGLTHSMLERAIEKTDLPSQASDEAPPGDDLGLSKPAAAWNESETQAINLPTQVEAMPTAQDQPQADEPGADALQVQAATAAEALALTAAQSDGGSDGALDEALDQQIAALAASDSAGLHPDEAPESAQQDAIADSVLNPQPSSETGVELSAALDSVQNNELADMKSSLDQELEGLSNEIGWSGEEEKPGETPPAEAQSKPVEDESHEPDLEALSKLASMAAAEDDANSAVKEDPGKELLGEGISLVGVTPSAEPEPMAAKNEDGEVAEEIGSAFDAMFSSAAPPTEAYQQGGLQAETVADVASTEAVLAAMAEAGNTDKKETRVFNAEAMQQLQAEQDRAVDDVDPALLSIDWYIAIDDEQIGPVTLERVQEHWAKGELTGESLHWRQGMGDWEPIEDHSDLMAAMPVSKPPTPAPSVEEEAAPPKISIAPAVTAAAAVSAVSVAAASAGAEVSAASDVPAPAVASDPGSPAGSIEQAPAANGSGVGASAVPEMGEGDEPSWRPSAASALASLAAEELSDPPAVSAAVSKKTDVAVGSAIPATTDALEKLLAGDEKASATAFGAAEKSESAVRQLPKRTEAIAAIPLRDPIVSQERSRNNTVLIVAMICGTFLLLGVLFLAFGNRGEPKEPIAKAPVTGQTAAPKPPVSPTPQPVAGQPLAAVTPKAGAQPETANPVKPAPTPAKTEEVKTAPVETKQEVNPAVAAAGAGAVAAAATKAVKAAKPAKKKPRRKKRTRPRRTKPRVVEEAPPPPPPPPRLATRRSGEDELLGVARKRRRRVVEEDNDLPKQLDDSDVLGVLRKNRKGVQRCRQKADGVSGTMTVKLVISRSGRTGRVTISPSKFKSSDVGKCMTKEVKRWRFPKFSGRPMPLEFPVRISG